MACSRTWAGGWLADLSYVGNKGTHFQVLADYNQAAPCVAGATAATCGNAGLAPPRAGLWRH